jgi:hypothetical protein
LTISGSGTAPASGNIRIEDDGGWAYLLKGIYSETFATRAAAEAAALRAAAEQKLPDEPVDIEFEDRNG